MYSEGIHRFLSVFNRKAIGEGNLDNSVEKKGKSKIYAISFVLVLAIAITGFYFWSSTKDNQGALDFDAQFTLRIVEDNSSQYYHRYGQWYDNWAIRISKLTDGTVRDVDVWTYNGGPSPEIVRHYDYLSGKASFIIQALRVKNQTVTVAIYWEGGHVGFYCNPWEK